MQNTIRHSCESPWPALDFNSWQETLGTLHLFTQIVGKIRLRHMPWQNHSWHTSLFVSPRGFSTGPVPYGHGLFEVQLDFENHRAVVNSSFAPDAEVKLYPRTVASFYQELFEKLASIGIQTRIHAAPNEIPEAIPFAEDEVHAAYDGDKVSRFWQACMSVHYVFQRFRSRYLGKCSPVQFFWGSFDLAVTRFSGRKAPLHPGGLPNVPLAVMQEAYSQEVSSCGFWPGSEHSPQPVFYSYCYPTPEAFGKMRARPDEAFYSEEMGEFFLPYDAVRQAEDPAQKLMDFLQSTWEAAAITGNWNRDLLETTSPGFEAWE